MEDTDRRIKDLFERRAAAVPVGWQRISCDVTITSAAPEPDLRRLVAQTNCLCPMLANLSRDIEQVHHLTIVCPAERVVP